MGTRVYGPCNVSRNYAESKPEMKAIYCPKCGRKVTEVQMMEGYLTCPKCRYNYYKFMLGGLDLNISSQMIESNRKVIGLLNMIRTKMYRIYMGNDVGKIEIEEEQTWDEEGFPFC